MLIQAEALKKVSDVNFRKYISGLLTKKIPTVICPTTDTATHFIKRTVSLS